MRPLRPPPATPAGNPRRQPPPATPAGNPRRQPPPATPAGNPRRLRLLAETLQSLLFLVGLRPGAGRLPLGQVRVHRYRRSGVPTPFPLPHLLPPTPIPERPHPPVGSEEPSQRRRRSATPLSCSG